MAAIREVTVFVRPYDFWHDDYQAYYRTGLARYARGQHIPFHVRPLTRFPRLMRVGARVIRSTKVNSVLRRFPEAQRRLDRIMYALEGPVRSPSGFFQPAVGQYMFTRDDRSEIKVCVDAHDSGEVSSKELLDWASLYFKTNYWPQKAYAKNVKPLANGNPLVLPHFGRLRKLRHAPKQYDLCFIVRVWGGHNETEGVEHNLRLLENIAKVECRKFLLAYLVTGNIQEQARRLERVGVPWTCRPMPLTRLWEISGASKLNILRLGMHQCCPWRLMDLLAIGASIVLEAVPRTEWPTPLRKGKEFLCLDLPVNEGAVLSPFHYSRIPDRIMELLTSEGTLECVSKNAAAYFDREAEPASLARVICEAVERY